MDAWCLDDSPGAYRWASLEDPPLAPDDVAVRPVASALNHMDLLADQGSAEPPPAPRARVRRGRRRHRGGPGGAWGSPWGTRWSSTRPSRRSRRSWPWATTRRSARGSRSWGSSAWGGHGTRVVVPARNVLPKPAGRSWEECAAYPLATLTRLEDAPAGPAVGGERCLIVGIGGGVSTAALHLAVRMGAEVHVTSRDPAKGRRPWRPGRRRRCTTPPRSSR